jgi:tetratricopeptide (TPR) repeat protein
VKLPRPATSFVGRRSELEEVVDLLAGSDTRLVTLLGPGGIGKTRLAIEAARQGSERSGVPAHFFSLEGIRSTGDVVKALGDSLGFVFDIHISAQISEQTQLFDRLAAQPLLLLLDNLEHLDDVSDLVAEMLDRIPTLVVLATSRRQLDLSAEWRLEVRGLDANAEADAVELFIDRARQAGAPQAALDEGSEPIAALCGRLGGMPLAIELAASWAGMLSPSEIAEEIGHGLDLLESSARDTPDRHRSIRTVFDHSWERLDEGLRATFARLSVFEAPFDRSAASAVAGASLPDLMRLVKQSLVSRPELDRFSLHPLLRELASERLGDEAEAMADRYARYFWSFLVERDGALQGSLDQMAVRDEVAEQLDHIRAASDRWMDRYDEDDAIAAIRALYEFYFLHSFSDGLTHFQRMSGRLAVRYPEPASSRVYLWSRVLEAEFLTSFGTPDDLADLLDPLEPAVVGEGGELRAAWLADKGIELCLRNDYPASIDVFDEALEVLPIGRPVHSASLLAWLGWAHFQLGDFARATAVFDRGLEIAVGSHHSLGEAFLLSKSGLAADAAGDHDRAAQLHHEGREIFAKAGDVGGQGYTLSRLSWTSYLKGEFEVARRYALEGLAMFEEINHRWGIAVSYGRLGLAEVELGQIAEASGHFLACLDEAMAAGLVEQQHYAVTGIGRALVAAERWPEAVAILRSEATADSNPYQAFAKEGLGLVPNEVAPGDDDVDFEELIARAKACAEELSSATPPA